MCDTVTVTWVPCGPDVGDMMTSGLPKELKSDVAYTELRSGRISILINAKMMELLNSIEKFRFITNKNWAGIISKNNTKMTCKLY